ncbi:MAG TPA: acyltransferase [Candidatus Methylacidiphilales bacterium]
MSPRAHEPHHFAYIDAVRGYAFLGILFVHSAYSTGPFSWGFLAKQGEYGVQLFFLASAITLCFSMSARQEGKMDFVNFYLRRLFRIAPLFWLSMVFYWTVPQVIPASWLGQWAPQGVHASYFLLTTLFLHGWHPCTFNSIVPGGWSIAVEMTFYLVFPFCFHHITTLRRAALCLLGGIVFTVIQQIIFLHLAPRLWPGVHELHVTGFFLRLWFPAEFVYFLVGIFAYFLLKEPMVHQFYKSRFWSFWFLFMCAMSLWSSLHILGAIASLMVVMSLAGIVISIAGNSVPLVVNPLICYLGKLSYSCYLTHFAALGIVLRLLHVVLRPYLLDPASDVLIAANSQRNLAMFVLIAALTLILTVLFSIATHYLVENPGIALGKTVIRRINQRRLSAEKAASRELPGLVAKSDDRL